MPDTRSTGGATAPLPIVLVLADHYEPGWRAGGPIPSIRNMTVELADRFRFLVVTRDRDHLTKHPYPEVEPNRWMAVDQADVYYCSPGHRGIGALHRRIKSAEPDLVFANSLFSPFTRRLLALRRLHLLPGVPVLVAPRGELGEGALSTKRMRKRAYLTAMRLAGFLRDVHWQASNEWEAGGVRSHLKAEPMLASDIPARPPARLADPPAKRPGSIRLAFTARLAPKKNLSFLLRVLPEVKGEIDLDILGPAESREQDTIERLLDRLPNTVRAVYHGPVPPAEVEAVLSRTHFSVLPTLDENFGHSVYEALRLGRPVVISDRTPWVNLEAVGAGWDIPLERARWRAVLQECVDMDAAAFRMMSRAAFDHACRWFERTDPAAQQSRVFERVLTDRR